MRPATPTEVRQQAGAAMEEQGLFWHTLECMPDRVSGSCGKGSYSTDRSTLPLQPSSLRDGRAQLLSTQHVLP